MHIKIQKYLDKIQPQVIPPELRKQFNDACSLRELKHFQGLTGTLLFVGQGVLPQDSYIASSLKQCVGQLKVKDLVSANKILCELRLLTPFILFPVPSTWENPPYFDFYEASTGRSSYGKTDYISENYVPAGGKRVYHSLDHSSSKHGHVSFSSMGVEILATATSIDRASLTEECLQTAYGAPIPSPKVITTDSNGLYSTIATLNEGREYLLRPTVAKSRTSFETGEITTMQWISGHENINDSLTKHNILMFRKLEKGLKSGKLDNQIRSQAKHVKFGHEHMVMN